MTFSATWPIDITVSDSRGDAAETLLNQIKFTALDRALVTMEFHKPNGSKITFSDGSSFIDVRCSIIIT